MLMSDEGHILIGIVLGVLMGIGIAMALIDDCDSFRIPLTNKVFVRQAPKGE
jgi:hypothetical protein